MMTKQLLLTATAVLATFTAGATVIPVTESFGHNEKDNFGGNIGDMTNGSGMNGNGNDGIAGWPTGQGDPSTWSATANAYQAEWQSQDLLDGGENPTNGKIGWAIFDLGSSTAGLDELHIWHIRENNAVELS